MGGVLHAGAELHPARTTTDTSGYEGDRGPGDQCLEVQPPTPGRCERIVSADLRAAEESLVALTSLRLTAESIERMVALGVGGAGQLWGGVERSDREPSSERVIR